MLMTTNSNGIIWKVNVLNNDLNNTNNGSVQIIIEQNNTSPQRTVYLCYLYIVPFNEEPIEYPNDNLFIFNQNDQNINNGKNIIDSLPANNYRIVLYSKISESDPLNSALYHQVFDFTILSENTNGNINISDLDETEIKNIENQINGKSVNITPVINGQPTNVTATYFIPSTDVNNPTPITTTNTNLYTVDNTGFIELQNNSQTLKIELGVTNGSLNGILLLNPSTFIAYGQSFNFAGLNYTIYEGSNIFILNNTKTKDFTVPLIILATLLYNLFL